MVSGGDTLRRRHASSTSATRCSTTAARTVLELLVGPNARVVNDISRADLATEPHVQELLDRPLPITSPDELLRIMFSCRELVAAAAGCLSEAQRVLLLGDQTAPWEADVALLDVAASVLGEDSHAEAWESRTKRLARALTSNMPGGTRVNRGAPGSRRGIRCPTSAHGASGWNDGSRDRQRSPC